MALRRPTRTPLLVCAISALGLAAAPSEAPDLRPDPARVAEIAGLLPESPVGVGRPASDRAAWERLASLPSWRNAVREGERLLGRPMPPLTDEAYLDYSKTGNRTRGERAIGERRAHLGRLVLAECAEAKGRFLPAIEEAIRSTCEEKSWVLPAHDGDLRNFTGRVLDIDLASSALSWTLATACWWLGDRLSEETRRRVAEELERRTFRPYESFLETGQPQMGWVTGTNNWNAVCHAGVNGAAQAAIAWRERRAFYAAAAEKHMAPFLSGFTADGYCSEGIGYWNYGFGHYAFLAESLRRLTDGKVDLFGRKDIRPIALFARRMEILPGIYPAFADCSPSARPDGRLLALLEVRLGMDLGAEDMPGLAAPAANLFGVGIYGFLPEGADVRPPSSAPPELRSWFPDAGILIARPAPGAGRALGVALKGGHNAEHHNHNDVGSFVVAIAGETPIFDPGSETYTARTFSVRRYESAVLNSFGHSVPRVAGKLQRTGRRAEGKVLAVDFSDREDVLRLDIASAYEVPELAKLEREFRFSREGSGALAVRDEVAFSEAKEFEIALILSRPWKRLDAGRIRVGEGSAALEVSIDTGGEEFEIAEDPIEEEVHGPKPTRLGIRLRNPVERASVRISIRPAPEG
ncbi:MAG: heparinase II/III domain-containing protein [Planctomycetota bacterium]